MSDMHESKGTPTSFMFVLALVSMGCGGIAGEEEETGELESAINHGSLVTATGAPYNAIYSMWLDQPADERCTAIKIHDNGTAAGDGDIFLTAGHCTRLILENNFASIRLSLIGGSSGNFTRHTLSVGDVFVHPSFSGVRDLDNDTSSQSLGQSYDVGVFQITDSTDPLNGPIWPTALSGGFLPDSSLVTFVGMGEDAFDSTHSFKKQQGTDFTSQTGTIALNTRYFLINNLDNTNAPAPNGGDSGGPLFTGSGSTAKLWGVAANRICFFHNSDGSCQESGGQETRFTKIINVLRWINTPHNLTDDLDFEGEPIITDGSEVFLQNRQQRKCISQAGAGQSLALADCGAAVPQNYRLIFRESPNYYALQNTGTGQCLRVTEAGTLKGFGCSSGSVYQRFAINRSEYPRIRLRPRSFNSCVTAPLAHTACNGSTAQEWFLYR